MEAIMVGPRLNVDHNALLIAPFTDADIKKAL